MNNSNGSEEAVFLAALQLQTVQERVSYVQAACAGNAELHRRVTELLASHDAVNGPLDFPLFGAANASTLVDASDAHLGTQIGPYKLLQVIGEGGMGVVYMAEQTEPVRRKVALKLIRPGMDSQQVIARFQAERQALALMDHVNIARVLDAGMTGGNSKSSGGRPYFVMELIHGVPITKYCDDNHLPPRQRLELFVPVCLAIQHAHQKGIIHRDIKPSNVMVTLYDGKPVPKVIDFGVAKATAQKLTERTLFTQYGTMVGTLEYMSPEQAEMSALGVDTRSDIYSLGVLLFELLTGSTPLDRKRLRESAYGEILRMIREEESPRPSTRLSESQAALASISAQRQMEPVRLAKLIRGELDWIVLKCLEKDRNRRYETANGFAADIQRYLNDEPVRAFPPSSAYRFSKFARRNKGILATAGLIALTLVVGTAISVWQAVRATTAEGLATTNFNSAEIQRQKAQSQVHLTEQANDQALRRLYEAQLAQVNAGSLSQRSGQRLSSLETLTKATALARELRLPAENDLRLRNAAIACFALSDLRLDREWDGWSAASTFTDFDGNLERYARGDVHGAVSIHRVDDNVRIALLPATGDSSFPLLSRNGQFVMVHSANNVQVWSLVESTPALVFELATGTVISMDLSSDGRRIVLIEVDGTITVHDLASGQPSRQLPPVVPGGGIAISPDSQEVAIACDTGVQIRSLNSGEISATLQHSLPVHNLAWHPNGKMLAGDSNLHVCLWDTSTSEPRFILGGFANGGIKMTFSTSGDLLATTGWEGKMRLWDSRTGRQVFSTMCSGGMKPQFSTDDHHLSVSIHDEKIGLWEVAECKEFRTLVHAGAESTTSYFNPTVFSEGNLLAVGVNGGVGVWELSSGRELAFLKLPGVNFTASGPAGSLLTNGSAGLLRWDVVRDSSRPGNIRLGPPRKLSIPGSICDVSSSRDGSVIASAQFNGGMVLHTGRPDQPVQLVPHEDVRYVSVSSDGKLVATGSHSHHAVRIWNSVSGEEITELPGAFWRATFSPDGKWLGSVAGGFRLWKVDTWEEGPKIGGGEGAAFSPDTSILAVESGEGSIRLLDPNTGNEYARLEDPSQDRARHITFSPDGTQLLATNDDSRSIHVWDLRLIRTQLAQRGLDWNLPIYPAPKPNDQVLLTVEIDETVLDEAH